MEDVNEDSNSSSWPQFYGEKTFNHHYYNSFAQRTVVDTNTVCDDFVTLKQKMLEHEAIFKNQVYELHRLYRRQRDMMEEVKNHRHRISIDTSSSSSLKPYEDAQSWHPLVNACVRPTKVRKRLFDLELPPDDNIDQEHEEIELKQASEESSYNAMSPQKCFNGSTQLADLNEPAHFEEPVANGPVDGLGPSSKPKGSPFLGPPRGLFDKSQSSPFDRLLHETGNSRFPALCKSSSSLYTNPADFGNSRGKSNGSLTHKLTSLQKQPSFLPSPTRHSVFEDKWRVNGCYTPNGFHHGSSSGSKDPWARLASSGFDHRNYNNLDDRSQKIPKGSNFIDLTDTTKCIDLNLDSNGSRKCNQTLPQWLQAKPDIGKNESRCDNRVENRFKIFGNSCVSRNDTSSLASTSASLRCARENLNLKTEMENRGFDMNVAWDANSQIDVEDCNLKKKTDTETGKVKNNFDLNSCLTEDEDVLVPESVKSSSETKKITMEIDLEAPAVPEAEEEEAETEAAIDDEFLAMVAAEAIVTMTGISSQQDQERSLSGGDKDNNRLLWFAEVVENAWFVNERDEYEELTLQQEPTKEEDYMPKPLVLDFQEPDEVGPARPRRGQARRGRPRRDFQSDILPGLVSLSRHEVTEDLQIFGGLMRATGHSWNVGPARRNGTRGRPKSVAAALPPPATSPPPPPPPTLSEVVGLEERRLTGWGKTTRRPRRQRSAAGTFVAVPLT